MSSSEQQDQLAGALVAFQAEMGAVPKTSDNPFFHSKFADMAACAKQAMPIHTKHGLAVTQKPGRDEVGNPTLVTRLMHVSGQWDEGETPLFLSKNDPQNHAAALSFMRRWAYCAALGIVADEDDDGNSTRAPAAQTSRASVPSEAASAPAQTPRKATGATKKAPATLKEAVAPRKATAPSPDGLSDEPGSATAEQSKRIWAAACALTGWDKPAAAEVRGIIKTQGKLVFNDWTSDRDLSEGEAEVFIDNLNVVKNGQKAAEVGPEVSEPLVAGRDFDSEEF